MTATSEALAQLLTYYFEQSKLYAYWGLGISTAIYLIGVLGVFISRWKERLATVIIALTVIAVVLTSFSGEYRSTAEALKRHQEYVDGLGVPISVSLLTDAYVGVDHQSVARIANPLLPGTQFASVRPPSPARFLEDIAESAWFSAKIAKTCAYWTLAVFCAGILFALLWMHGTLIHITTAAREATELTTFSIYGSLAGGLILFFVSTGTLQTSIGYFGFARAAEKTEEQCKNLITSGKTDMIDAVSVIGEYQVSRSKAPFLPTFVYQMQRDQLNQLWNLRRNEYQRR